MENKKMSKINYIISHRMLDLGLNKTQFAKACGIDRALFSCLINGKRSWSKLQASRVIEVLPELTYQDFFCEE